MLAGQVSVQGAAGLTVTANVQLPTVLFEPSFARQLTVVVPNGKLEPDGGLQVMVTLGQPLGAGDA